MKIKVKIKEPARAMIIHYAEVSESTTVNALLDELVEESLINVNLAHNLEHAEDRFDPVHRIKAGELFEDTHKHVLTSAHLELTLTMKSNGGTTLAGLSLIDFSEFLKTVHEYYEMEQSHPVADGMLFYIQHDEEQFIIRKEPHGLEFFHFQKQYGNAHLERDRAPFLWVELKARKALAKEELNWLRSVTYPVKERKNPLIHLKGAALDQDILHEIAVLIHRIIVIIGKFYKNSMPLEKYEDQLPTYVESGERTTVGYVKSSQLEQILSFN